MTATRIHDGRRVPAYRHAPPRVTQSDIARFGSYEAAREALTERASAPSDPARSPAASAANRGSNSASAVDAGMRERDSR